MATVDILKIETNNFFNRYWHPNFGQVPEWSEIWDFNSTIPNHDKRGCYALLKQDKIVYIGSGLGKSTERYQGYGLGDRLKSYWSLNKEPGVKAKYIARPNWELTGILTIGFSTEDYVLAAALEIYLIRKLQPIKNKVHK